MGADVGVYETLGMIDIELYGGKRGFIEHQDLVHIVRGVIH